MKREIIFRGKRKDNGQWVYGYVEESLCRTIVCIRSGRLINSVDPETVGQYTGLKDNYDKMIFEGDIFEVGTLRGVVTWHPHGYWCIHTEKEDIRRGYDYNPLGKMVEYGHLQCLDYEVIGNIHDK